MPTIERSFSDVLRHSGDVLREAEHQDVVLRRRDGADVMLVDLRRELAIRQVLADAGRIVTALADGDNVDRLTDVLPTVLPWTRFLPSEERSRFLHEFGETVAACLDAEVFEPLGQLDREWRATAAVYADPALLAALSDEELSEDVAVPLPAT